MLLLCVNLFLNTRLLFLERGYSSSSEGRAAPAGGTIETAELPAE